LTFNHGYRALAYSTDTVAKGEKTKKMKTKKNELDSNINPRILLRYHGKISVFYKREWPKIIIIFLALTIHFGTITVFLNMDISLSDNS
jgi:hypothetical protein